MGAVLPTMPAGSPATGDLAAAPRGDTSTPVPPRGADAADLTAGIAAAGCILGIVGLSVGIASTIGSDSSLLALALPVAAVAAAAAGIAIRRLIRRQLAAAASAQADALVADLKNAFDYLPEGVAVWNADGRLLAANRHYRATMPRIAAAITGGEDFEDLLETEIEGGYAPAKAIHRWRERRLLQKLGDERSLVRRVDGCAYRVREHQIDGGCSVTISNDVTELLAREQALREQEERFTVAQLAASEGLWDLDLRTGAFYAAPNVVAFVGRSSTKDFRPVDWLRRIHRGDLAGYRRQLRAHLRGEIPVLSATYRIDDGCGGERWIADRALALRDSTGVAYRIAGTVADISESKAAERRLEKARQDAEIANRAKTEFLASVSHELRTPLNAIIGFSQLLRELAGTSERHRTYVDNVLQAGVRLTDTIDELLDIAAAEAGRLNLADEHVELADCIDVAIAALADNDTAPDALVACHGTAMLPPIRADRGRIIQLLRQVIAVAADNARAPGRLRLDASWSPSTGIVLRLSAGPGGLDGDRLKHVLNLASLDRGNTIGGPGAVDLGLVLAGALMRQHDGSLSLVVDDDTAALELRFPAHRLD